MAGMSRTMSRSLLSSTRSLLRSCGSEAAASAKPRSLGGSSAGRPSVAPPSASSNSFFQTRRPASFFYRLPEEMACMQSLLPLHCATASARMVAQLSTTAGALLQDGEDGT